MNHVIREQLRDGHGLRQGLGRLGGRPADRRSRDSTSASNTSSRSFTGEIPVVVHTQGYQVIMSTLRILHDEFNLKVIIGHGCFDSYLLSEEILKRGIPVMAGPRVFRSTGRRARSRAMWPASPSAASSALGVNTDAPVVPQEELFFQATMAVRFGWTDEAALRGPDHRAGQGADDRQAGRLAGGRARTRTSSSRPGSILDPRHLRRRKYSSTGSWLTTLRRTSGDSRNRFQALPGNGLSARLCLARQSLGCIAVPGRAWKRGKIAGTVHEICSFLTLVFPLAATPPSPRSRHPQRNRRDARLGRAGLRRRPSSSAMARSLLSARTLRSPMRPPFSMRPAARSCRA